MLDAVSLDQLRTFIAAVDEGSFSAASRKLLRSQSVVSETISNLEEQIGVRLFDRSGRYPKLTAAGIGYSGQCSQHHHRGRLAEGPGEGHVGWPGAGIVGGGRSLLSDRRNHPSGKGISAA